MLCQIPIQEEGKRKKRLELLRNKIKIALDLKSKGMLSLDELLQLKADLDEFQEMEVVERCRHSVLEFGKEFFSVDLNPDYEENIIPKGAHVPEFHEELTSYLDDCTASKGTYKLGWSVARGHSKSSWLSQVYPVYLIVYKKPSAKFILTISESAAMAQRFVDFVRNALKFSSKLIQHFGRLLEENPKANERDNVESFITKSIPLNKGRCLILASSTSKQLRGVKFGNTRPLTILADDLESSRNTNTKELRDSMIDWWQKTIEPIGEPNTKFIYMGTLVHGEGLLPYIMSRPDYKSKIYPAITQYPSDVSQHLWEEFEKIYSDVSNVNRETEADAFYEENKEVMNSDVDTLWWDRFDYKTLTKIKCNISSRAFNSEYLNIPSDADSMVFTEEIMHYYRDEQLPKNLEIYTFWDIAITGRGDYQAIITLGRERKTGILYVLDTDIVKCKMHEGLEHAIKAAKKWQPRIFGVETVQAQVEMARQLQSRLVQDAVYSVKVKGVKPRGNKQYRIEQIQPLVEQGILRFKKDQKLLLEQMFSFPSGTYDDGPDSLAQCVNLIKFRRGHLAKPNGA